MEDNLFTRAMDSYYERQRAQKEAAISKAEKEKQRTQLLDSLKQQISDELTVIDDTTQAANLKEIVNEEEISELRRRAERRQKKKKKTDNVQPLINKKTEKVSEADDDDVLGSVDTDDEDFSFIV